MVGWVGGLGWWAGLVGRVGGLGWWAGLVGWVGGDQSHSKQVPCIEFLPGKSMKCGGVKLWER